MKLVNIVLILLIFAAFATGFAGFYGALTSEYGVDTTDFTSLNISAGWYQDIQSDVETQANKLDDSQTEGFDFEDLVSWVPGYSLISGAYKAIMLILSLPGYFISLFTDIVGLSPYIPGWVATFANTVVTVIILYALFDFLVGRN